MTDEKPITEDTSSVIDKANQAAERLELANKSMFELLARQERMLIEMKLGGRTIANVPQKTKEDEENDEIRKLLAETGYESAV